MQETPRLILINANVITLDPNKPRARWITIDGGRITALGDAGTGPTPVHGSRVVDCKGATILPGFIDAHIHLHALAKSLTSLSLRPENGIHTIADIQSVIRRQAEITPPGVWIRAEGYHEFDLAEQRHPHRKDLDQAAPDHPVKLTHRSGHAHVLNSLGLKLARITVETADPDGSLIDRDPTTGSPTGVLFEMGGLLSDRIPPIDNQTLEKSVKDVNDTLLSYGITAVHEASSRNDMNRWNLFKTWKKKDLLKTRLQIMLGIDSFLQEGPGVLSSVGSSDMGLTGVKIILDESTGDLHPSQERLNECVSAIHNAGHQAVIHAITPKSIEATCIAVEYALKQDGNKQGHRHRIEHCSVCPPALAGRIAALGIQVVTQPGFILANGDRYLRTVPPDELPYLYPLKTLIAKGVHVAGSSDAPISPIVAPLTAIRAAVTRKSSSGATVTQDEAISIPDALEMYTRHAARATCLEDDCGTISPGKLADLVVLDGDPLQLPADKIEDLHVGLTIINGRILWKRKEWGLSLDDSIF